MRVGAQARVEVDVDHPAELKARLRMWEKGEFSDLVDRVTAAALRISEKRRKGRQQAEADDLLSKGAAARRTACAGAVGKGMQKFVGAPAHGTPSEQASWAGVEVRRRGCPGEVHN